MLSNLYKQKNINCELFTNILPKINNNMGDKEWSGTEHVCIEYKNCDIQEWAILYEIMLW